MGMHNLHYEKFSDGTIDCIEDEVPFSLPKGWEWSRVKIFCVLNPKNNMSDNEPASFIPMPLIKEGYSNVHSYEERTWALIKNGFTHFANNDIGIAKITPCFENRKSVVFRNLTNGAGSGTTELFIVRSISDQILSDYLLWNFKTQRFIDGGVQTYTGDVGQQRVRRDYLANYLIAIPPINEQIRILESIDSCFKLVDTIDDSRCEMSDLISKAKSKILDLAIRGKLVPQNPEDEPASALLERIRAEKEELIRQGKIKRDKKESVIFKGEDNSYYENLPSNWTFVTLGTISQLITKGTTPRGGNVAYIDSGIGFLRAENVLGYDRLSLENLKYIDEETNKTFLKRSMLHEGDILITIAGTLGRTAIVRGKDLPLNTNQAIAIVRPVDCQLVDVRYIVFALNASYISKALLHQEVAMAIPNLSLENISDCVIPLPPIAEQGRIVASISELFSSLENIENSLS